MKTLNKSMIVILSLFVLAGLSVASKTVYADCTTEYGGGQNCVFNKRFEIKKEVKLCDKDGNNCSSDWKSKVTGVKKDQIVLFRIKVKNLSDKEAKNLINFDDMSMKDFLPREMTRVGGDGLTEDWNDFQPGETKDFIIKAVVKSDEYDKDEKFTKCVVNKAEVRWKGKFEGSDTATVCFGNETPTELPKTGADMNSIFGLIGAGLIGAGVAVKKVYTKATKAKSK